MILPLVTLTVRNRLPAVLLENKLCIRRFNCVTIILDTKDNKELFIRVVAF